MFRKYLIQKITRGSENVRRALITGVVLSIIIMTSEGGRTEATPAFQCRCGNITAGDSVERMTMEKRDPCCRLFNRMHQIWNISHGSLFVKQPGYITASAVVEHCFDLSCRCQTRFRLYIRGDDKAMIQQQNDFQGKLKRAPERRNSLDDFAPDIRAFLQHDMGRIDEVFSMISPSYSGDLINGCSLERDPDMEIMFSATKPPEVGSCGTIFSGFGDYQRG